VVGDAGVASLAGLFALASPLEDDAIGVLVGESDGAVGAEVGDCVGVAVDVGAGVGAGVGAVVGVGVAPGGAALAGEVVAEGQLGVVGACVNGRAEGTVTGLWLACAPDRFTSPVLVPAGLPELAGLADVGHDPGLDVRPVGPVPGRAPRRLLPADLDGVAVCRASTAGVLPPAPPEPPVPLIAGCTSALPPFSTVELTWTSAARSGGTATAAAVIDAAAARPATSRIHPTPCGRRVVQSDAAQRPVDAATGVPASRARVVRINRATRCADRWSRQ
jgi:hypothetical protein